ncbi:polymer-forming cytoskeletal protein [Paraburkholderia dipogonis]|uniref:polymer-forming cytoskeletal protein n=1 Tax=Paraburkholderia dipogonis TaxID=1211383 RepID=UPI0035E79015
MIADHFVELQSNAHVTGNIYYQQLRMDCGASVDGKLTQARRGAGGDAASGVGGRTAPSKSARPV